jgi:hypothetical protein
MEINLTTPALLFPAISLLMLAYTNRFLALSSLIRTLYSQYQETKDTRVLAQIGNLRRRIFLIRNMQALGVGSMLLCMACMFVLFIGQPLAGKVLFAISLLCMIVSLTLSFWEISISVDALNVQLHDMEEDLENARR